jgi:hypothetical protein
MIRVLCLAGCVAVATCFIAGCGQKGAPAIKTYEVQMPTGVDQAKQILKRYASGSPLGSEVSSFSKLIEDVKKTDADKAALLEKGFADLQKASGPKRAAIAKELLGKL